jgi:hypothetical protein
MGRLFAATLMLSVSLCGNAKYGGKCETFEPSTEEVSRVRSLVADEVPADAELSSACILMKSERFAPTVEWAKRLTYEYRFVWLVESGASGTQFYRESSCRLSPTERVSCSDSMRFARMEDGQSIDVDDTITDDDVQSVLAFSRRTLGDTSRVSSIETVSDEYGELRDESGSKFEITLVHSPGQLPDEAYYVTRLCDTPAQTLEKCKWKLIGPRSIMY